MDRLWSLKFTSIFPVPGNQINMFFDAEEKAKEVFDKHIKLLELKPDGEMSPLVFDDLLGHQCLRSSFFPHCIMVEIGPYDVAWVEIKKKCDDSQRAVGIVQNVGFKSELKE